MLADQLFNGKKLNLIDEIGNEALPVIAFEIVTEFEHYVTGRTIKIDRTIYTHCTDIRAGLVLINYHFKQSLRVIHITWKLPTPLPTS